MPFFPLASHFTTFLFGHVQKSKFWFQSFWAKKWPVFRLFVFNFNFFLSFFLLFLSFCCSYWPSTGHARKAILSQEILPWVFHSNFWPFSCIFQAPSSRSLWSGYHWKDLFFLQNLNRWCHFQSKAIKSDVEQRLRLITVGYCWHRSQWVKDIK